MKPQWQTRPIEILMVEDSPSDTMLAREAFRDAKVLNTLHCVEDGVQALEFLRRQAPYTSVPRPDLILLDLSLPRMSGLDVLAAIKADDDLRAIPVVMLTTSKADEDIIKAYNRQVNCYIVKPVEFDCFMKVIGTIETFWFSIVTLPGTGAV